MFRIGSVTNERIAEFSKAGKPLPSLHSPEYYPEPRTTISTGVSAMSAALLELLPVGKK